MLIALRNTYVWTVPHATLDEASSVHDALYCLIIMLYSSIRSCVLTSSAHLIYLRSRRPSSPFRLAGGASVCHQLPPNASDRARRPWPDCLPKGGAWAELFTNSNDKCVALHR